MIIDPPEGLRKGQAIFNFLAWVAQQKDARVIHAYPKHKVKGDESHWIFADPFNIPDEKWDALYAQWLRSLTKGDAA